MTTIAPSKRGRAGVASYTRRHCASCGESKPAAGFRIEAHRERFWPDCADCREAALLTRVGPVLEEARRRYEAGESFTEIRALLRVADPTARRLAADWNHTHRAAGRPPAPRRRPARHLVRRTARAAPPRHGHDPLPRLHAAARGAARRAGALRRVRRGRCRMIRPALTPAPPLDCAPRGQDGSAHDLEHVRTIVPRVLARLCLTCDGHAADASHHCTRCGAELDAEGYPELVV